MGEQIEIEDLPEMGRVKPRLSGHGLALPPLAAITAVGGILLGLIAGLSLAPRPPQAQATSTPSVEATFSSDPAEYTTAPFTYEIDDTVVWPATPPPGGLSLQDALAMLYGHDPSILPGQVTSANVALQSTQIIGRAPTDPVITAPRWVWIFVVSRPDASPECVPGEVTQDGVSGLVCFDQWIDAIELDYVSGELVVSPSTGWITAP